ncbi:MAG: C4-type zinc ribbon domain-containing protein [Acidimicrobiales bacterium]
MNGPALLAVQLLDSQLDALDGRRRRLPERAALDTARAAHAAHVAERTRLAGVAAEAGAAVERAEHEGAELDTKQRRLEAQLKTVIAPREAEALMSEIASLKAKHGELDDVELEAMEQQGEAETGLAALAEAEPALLDAVAAAEASLAEAEAGIAAEVADVSARREQAAAALTPDELSTYTSMRARFGGVAIAQLERRTCTGCHVDLSPMEHDQVKSAPAGELPECPNCSRLLVV